MLLAAWLLAVCCSAPQLQVWTVSKPVPDWSQCTDVWTVWEYHNISSPVAEMVKTVYEVSQVVVLFWLPLIVVVICYVIVLKSIYKNLDDIQEFRLRRARSASFQNQTSFNNSGRRTAEPASRLLQENRRYGSIRCQCTTRQQPQLNPLLRRNISQMRVRRTKYRTLKIMVLIVTAYVAFWLPYNFLTVWHVVHIETYKLYVDRYLYIFYNLVAINAVVNPLIYSRLSFSFC